MYLIFDTETTGLPRNKNAPLTDLDNWPRLVQIAWQLHDSRGKLVSNENYIIKPEGFTIPFNAQKVHGISTERAEKEGHDLKEVLQKFNGDLQLCTQVIGHNIQFDLNIIGAEYIRTSLENILEKKEPVDTSASSLEFCGLKGGMGGRLKLPKLMELHEILFGEKFDDAHDAAYDVDATAKCFFGLLHKKVLQPADDTSPEEITYEKPRLKEANFAQQETKESSDITDLGESGSSIDGTFCHLHVHSQFSVLQATSNIKDLVNIAVEHKMPSVALTDLGNMFGAFKFVNEATNKGIKPILGCEFYIAEERTTTKFTKDNPDKRYNQVFLAKNKKGYHNLTKLSSLAYMEGLYGLYPRIDKELVVQYKGDLIALSGGLASEIPNLILNVGEHQAEEAFQWWHELFGEDFYVELNRHGLEEEDHVNEVLLRFAKKYGAKIIAANDVYYLNKEDANAHDVLLCIKEGEFQSTPIGRGRGYRYGFPNDEFYFKTQEEMKNLFSDLPEAIENIQEILEKVEIYKLKRDVLLPKFDIPEEFIHPEDEKDGGKRGENAYLRHITYIGAEKRYGELNEELRERIDFELQTIENTGYPGYFLIVQDFTSKSREMGVSVGPGRGSAAGSVVAYCIGITNVDPIKYDLLFERFLNPDRVSL
ncbi:MAG: DNA polymerase III subunit alpha, partial [Cyclobacteriaceae bacterium]|nr:DNA polymerase III subunit alpha [Cyclobacteriaceae bacterium]